MRRLLTLVALAMVVGCGGGSENNRGPVGILAVVLTFPSGGPEEGLASAEVLVVDIETEGPIATASVTVNGQALPYVAEYQDYEGSFALARGASVALEVRANGQTFRHSVPAFIEAPTIVAPAAGEVWASGCTNDLTWSGGAPADGAQALVGFLDASGPDLNPVLGPFPVPLTPATYRLSANGLYPGEHLAFVGITRETPIPGAEDGSTLLLVGARVAPFTVVNASYRSIEISPGNFGLSTGESRQFSAVGPPCDEFGPRWPQDLTAAATWSSSNPAVAVTGGASIGRVTGVAPGFAILTASVQGFVATTAVGVRDFTAQYSPATYNELLRAVTWTGSQAVAVGESAVLTSPDGVTWTAQECSSRGLTGIAASPNLLVAVAYGSNQTISSPDGVTWTAGGPAGNDGLGAITWTGTQFVAVGLSGVIFTSPDGLAWTERASGTTKNFFGVAASPSRLVAVGSGGLPDDVFVSPDGATWSPVTGTSFPYFLQAVTWTGTQFVAVGGGAPMTSPDGLAWTAQTGPGAMAVAASDTELMAVGESGTISASTDGRTWVTWTVGDAPLRGVTWTGSRWVIVGWSSTILTSP